MPTVEVLGVRIERDSAQPVVLLREQDGPRCLPIWIGVPEASAIAAAHDGIFPDRPMTHDLLHQVVTTLGETLLEVRIIAVHNGIFDTELVFGGGTVVSSRASDAIALAVRFGCQIWCDPRVLDTSGIALSTLQKNTPEEREIMKFRLFLDDVYPADFSDYQPEG